MTLTLLLGGDVMLGRGVDEVIGRIGPDYPFELLAHRTRAADLFLVNLECAISDRDLRWPGEPKAFYFRGRTSTADTLTNAGVSFACLANNHALDADAPGLLDTLDALRDRGIARAGAGPNLAEASRPAHVEAAGATVGVLALCDHQADFAAGPGRPGIRHLDWNDPGLDDALAAEVEALAAGVDHVVVAFHWQPNWAPRVRPQCRRLAMRLFDAGAALIWGHSPHHFQGVEWHGGAAAVYSAGDLLTDYAIDPDYRNDRQLLFEATLGDRGVERVRALPIELEFAHPHAAGPEARRWIAARFETMCDQVGSRIEPANEWLEVHPR